MAVILRRPFGNGASAFAVRTGLVSAWNLSNTLDSYGTNNLTNNSGVTFVPGKIRDAASFASANNQSLSVANNASVQVGTGSFWWAGWVKLTSKTATSDFASLYNSIANRRSWLVRYERSYSTAGNPADRIGLYVSSNGTYTEGVTAKYLADTSLGPPSTGVWYFVLVWYDSVNQTVNIKCNNGTTCSAAWTAGIYNNTTDAFFLGAAASNPGYMNGQIDSAIWGKAPPSGIAAVISDVSSTLYNGGNGCEWPWDFKGVLLP